MERVVAHRTGPPFAFTAKQAGKIISIDEKAKVVVLVYKNGSKYVVSYGPTYSKNGGGGFFTELSMVPHKLKENKSFKKGEVLLYNPQFFIPDPISGQVDMSLGVYANVAVLEDGSVVEDSGLITTRLSDKLSFYPTMERKVIIKKNTTIHRIAMPGTDIVSVDPIIIYDEVGLDSDDENADLLADINKATPKANYTGRVVDIKAYHRMPLSELSSSLRKVVSNVNALGKARAAAAKGADNSNEYIAPGAMSSDKVDNITLDDEIVVLKFYIREDLDMSAGDKLVYGGSLKSVISTVVKEIPTTTDGTEIDAYVCASSINNRIVQLPLYIGGLERYMEDVENEALDEYFD
jgi:hypothetical protein